MGGRTPQDPDRGCRPGRSRRAGRRQVRRQAGRRLRGGGEMTGPAARPSYTIRRVDTDFRPGDPAAPWPALAPLAVGHYLWQANGYRPAVEARLCWTRRFLYVRFRVEESRVRVRYTKFQDPVYKDSCVEFFVDAFPETERGYVNFETNAAGTLLAAFGPDRNHRTPLWPEDLAEF